MAMFLLLVTLYHACMPSFYFWYSKNFPSIIRDIRLRKSVYKALEVGSQARDAINCSLSHYYVTAETTGERNHSKLDQINLRLLACPPRVCTYVCIASSS